MGVARIQSFQVRNQSNNHAIQKKFKRTCGLSMKRKVRDRNPPHPVCLNSGEMNKAVRRLIGRDTKGRNPGTLIVEQQQWRFENMDIQECFGTGFEAKTERASSSSSSQHK